jgi:hypothetical protein
VLARLHGRKRDRAVTVVVGHHDNGVDILSRDQMLPVREQRDAVAGGQCRTGLRVAGGQACKLAAFQA